MTILEQLRFPSMLMEIFMFLHSGRLLFPPHSHLLKSESRHTWVILAVYRSGLQSEHPHAYLIPHSLCDREIDLQNASKSKCSCIASVLSAAEAPSCFTLMPINTLSWPEVLHFNNMFYLNVMISFYSNSWNLPDRNKLRKLGQFCYVFFFIDFSKDNNLNLLLTLLNLHLQRIKNKKNRKIIKRLNGAFLIDFYYKKHENIQGFFLLSI